MTWACWIAKALILVAALRFGGALGFKIWDMM
jgi:hypothetical protein